MVVYHVSLSPSQQQLHITRRGDRGGMVFICRRKEGKAFFFRGGRRGVRLEVRTNMVKQIAGYLDNNGGKECRGRGLAFFSLRRKGATGVEEGGTCHKLKPVLVWLLHFVF